MSLRTIGIYSESVSPIRKAGKRWEPLLVWHCVKDIRHLDKWWVGLLTLLLFHIYSDLQLLHLEVGDLQVAVEEGAAQVDPVKILS